MARVRPALDGESDGDAPVVIVSVPVPLDVMGYVASRVADETDRPAVVMAPRNGLVAAEARGPQGFNLVTAFHSMSPLFAGYGGHPRAAGFTIEASRVDEFRRRMLEFVRVNPPVPEPRRLDAIVPVADTEPALAADLERLRPFGQANPPATLFSPTTTREQFRDAAARGVHLSTPFRPGAEPTGVVYRLRAADGVALASVLDTVAAS
jgi:single-stranded DNA-specific DHH superfamily exonuclease